MDIRTTEDGWLVAGDGYQVVVSRDEPRVDIRDAQGSSWTELSLVSSVDTSDGVDETMPSTDRTTVRTAPDEVVFTRRRASTVWSTAEVRLRCTDSGIDLQVVVDAERPLPLADVTLAGGRMVRANGAAGDFRSRIGFASVFVPAPTEPVQVLRPAATPARLGVVGDADAGRLHGIFSPPPLVLGFGRALAGTGADLPQGGDWLAVGVVDAVDRLGFTTMTYEPLDGGWHLRLAYEGHTLAGRWESPRLVFTPATSPMEVLASYRELCGPPTTPGEIATWWLEPIFCGWGAQCALSVRAAVAPSGASAGLVGGEQAVRAPALSRQNLYDRWLAHLADNAIVPGTVVIDDKWQASYATLAPDVQKWPDLKGWIAQRHSAGQRVLLWFKAWDPEGLPPEECITDPTGRSIAADPTHPGYRERLAAAVASALGPDGLDADGFKVDFTQRTPSGWALRAAGPGWGVAALHQLLSVLHRAAKQAKPDALVVTHTVNPLFADVTDMVRLNDVLSRDSFGRPAPVVGQLAFRASVASATLPGTPIDTDQWPMPDKAEWLRYSHAQVDLGVPALYYVESIDNSDQTITDADLGLVADLWAAYRDRVGLGTFPHLSAPEDIA
ncbi:MAG: hypothetical protein LCH96_04005 [Actinobacteria bacterium]|nr:hypothetical protein [Actinomycetota bacterium]